MFNWVLQDLELGLDLTRSRRDTESWIFVKETVGSQDKAGFDGRHDGPVFRARNVMHTKVVPHDQIRVVERSVSLLPRSDSVLFACSLVRIVASRESI